MPDFQPWWVDPDRELTGHAGIGLLVGEGMSELDSLAAWAGSGGLRLARRRIAATAKRLAVFQPGLLAPPPLADYPGLPLISLTCSRIESAEADAPGWAADKLEHDGWETPALLTRATHAMAELVKHRVGGAFATQLPSSPPARRRVVVAVDVPLSPDATRRDIPSMAARRMIEAALAAHPASEILLVLPAGKRLQPLAGMAAAEGCAVAVGSHDPWPLLDEAREIYCVGGDLGLLGLLTGKKVHSFAASAYTGRGLTEDASDILPSAPRSLEAVFAAHCLLGTRYLDPFQLRAVSFEDTLALMASWRRDFARVGDVGVCLGIGFWKRDRIGDFFRTPRRRPVFEKTAEIAMDSARKSSSAIAYWPLPSLAKFPAQTVEAGLACCRIEDGFVRSVGLGANLMPPASIVADRSGIYFDPSRPSDLERILSETDFDEPIRQRARHLTHLLVARGVTKYNLAERSEAGPPVPEGRRRLFVPGQVEDDASVLLGGAGITSNAELLRRVRAGNPDAFILYKPHPDVEAGHRKGLIPDGQMPALCDYVVRKAPVTELIAWADEIHTLTSLTGFEALLRNRRVVVYGQPFYAGWGLTEDKAPVERRQRLLSLDELVAGTMLLYPLYIDPVTRLPCGPEVLIDRIGQPQLWQRSPLMRLRDLQGQLFRALRISGAMRPES